MLGKMPGRSPKKAWQGRAKGLTNPPIRVKIPRFTPR